MKRLRIGLPSLDQLSVDSPVTFAWLERGAVVAHGQASLAELGKTRQPLDCFLHPRDSLLTCLDLPPLPPSKTHAAVICAAQALVLGPLEQMHVAHGPRGSDGRVQVGWVPKAGLARLDQVLSQAQLKLRGLYSAPYALPVGGAALEDGYGLSRDSLHLATVHPLGLPPLATPPLEPAQRWSGALPGWGLQARPSQPSGAGWGRALACVALAVALWTLGLNLYAARQADAGQRLKTQMSQQVRQAFPELPVVLNPLQQARQQLAARQGGTDTGPRFSALLQLVGNHLPFMVGSVEQLTFEQGRLHLALLAGSRQPAQPGEWQAALAQAGYAATRDEQGWSIGPTQPVENAEASDE